MAKHRKACDEAGYDFLPLIADSLGGWEPESAAWIKGWIKQGTGIRVVDEEGGERVARTFFQEASLSLWKAKSAAIVRRLPEGEKLGWAEDPGVGQVQG